MGVVEELAIEIEKNIIVSVLDGFAEFEMLYDIHNLTYHGSRFNYRYILLCYSIN